VTPARFGSFALKAVAVCVGGGAVVGAATWSLVGAVVERDIERLAFVPVIAFYALPITIPFGIVSGLVAAAIVNAISRGEYKLVGRDAWVRVGTVAGACLGAACPLFMAMAGFGVRSAEDAFLWGGVGGAGGAACGGIVAWLGWREVTRFPESAGGTRIAGASDERSARDA
jgi:hypothetical protein